MNETTKRLFTIIGNALFFGSIGVGVVIMIMSGAGY